MKKFYYKVQAPADDRANAGVIEANDEDEALKKANAVYGIASDDSEIKLELIDSNEFDKLQNENGKKLTHQPQ